MQRISPELQALAIIENDLQSLKSFCEPQIGQRIDSISTIRVKNKQKSDQYSFVWTAGTPDLAESDYTMNPPEKEETKSETDYII